MVFVSGLFHLLVFPGFLFLSAVGLLLAGIDRKLLARMQRRIGPPLAQPLYDVLKLMGKETIVPAGANEAVYRWAPVVSVASLTVLALFIPVFGFHVFSGDSDLIVILYLLTIPGVALVIAAFASGSPFAGIGGSREIVTMISYELPLILVFLAVARKTGGAELCFSLQEIIAWQAGNGSLLTHVTMLPAAAAMLLVIPAEAGLHPFDVAEAETEICEGALAEYSGTPLALFRMSTSMKMLLMAGLFTALFLGGLGTGSLLPDILIFLAAAVGVTVVCMTLPHAVCARLKIEKLFRFFWTWGAGLALLSLVLAWCGL